MCNFFSYCNAPVLLSFWFQDMLNNVVADNGRFHAHLSDRKDEIHAERSVLDWFHSEPERLSDYVCTSELRLSALQT